MLAGRRTRRVATARPALHKGQLPRASGPRPGVTAVGTRWFPWAVLMATVLAVFKTKTKLFNHPFQIKEGKKCDIPVLLTY